MIPDRTRSLEHHPLGRTLMLGGLAGLAAAAMVLARPAAPAAAAGCDPAGTPVTWDGDAANGLWNDPLNWSGDALPAAGSHVCVTGAGVSVWLDAGLASVATIEVKDGAGLGVGNATLELTGPDPSTIGSLALFGGTLAGSGTRTITGSLVLYGGTLTGSATTSVAAGASLAHRARWRPDPADHRGRPRAARRGGCQRDLGTHQHGHRHPGPLLPRQRGHVHHQQRHPGHRLGHLRQHRHPGQGLPSPDHPRGTLRQRRHPRAARGHPRAADRRRPRLRPAPSPSAPRPTCARAPAPSPSDPPRRSAVRARSTSSRAPSSCPPRPPGTSPPRPSRRAS